MTSTPAMRAALRILTTSRCQVKTHQRDWPEFEEFKHEGRKPTPAESDVLHRRIMSLLAEGKTGREVAAIVGVHPVTVSKHKTGKVAKGK